MLLVKEQISAQMRKHAEKKNGLHDSMEIMIESMMVDERFLYSSLTRILFNKRFLFTRLTLK